MAKDRLTDYATTAADNEDVGGVGILGTNKISNFDNAAREIMSHLAETNAGTYPVADTWSFADPDDLAKIVRLDAGSITTGNTRVITAPDADLDLSGLSTQEEGDILYRGSSAWQRLAKGTAGQMLRQNAALTAPEWASGWETISRLDITTNIAAADFTDLGDYRMVRASGLLRPATDNVTFLVRASTDNGVSFVASSYGVQNLVASDTTVDSGRDNAATAFYPTTSVGTDSPEYYLQFEALFSEFNTAHWLTCLLNANYVSAAGLITMSNSFGALTSSSANDALRFMFSSGNIASGYIVLEGIRG